MHAASAKEKEVADFISYDTTSISKWVNGAKLPSSKNSEEIIRKLALFFSQRSGETDPEEIQRKLEDAWNSDTFFKEMESPGQTSLSLLEGRKELFDLIQKAMLQIQSSSKQSLEIVASFDILKYLGNRFYELLQSLPQNGIRDISLKLCMDMEGIASKHTLYCDTLLDTVAQYEQAQIEVIPAENDMPWILLLDNTLYIQLLYPWGDNFTVCYSMEKKTVNRFRRICSEMLNKKDLALTHASPENLRLSNVQLDSYSCFRQRLFFNEAPAMLLPPNIMEHLIGTSSDKNYTEYLRKLKRIFAEYTSKAHVDLILLSSMISQYILTGDLSLGNVPHHLNAQQVHDHIHYLSECMEKNPDFHVYVLKDTASLSGTLFQLPSIFIDDHAVTIENSKRKPNENYHISMYPQMIRIFQMYYDDMKGKPNCTELNPQELCRYL